MDIKDKLVNLEDLKIGIENLNIDIVTTEDIDAMFQEEYVPDPSKRKFVDDVALNYLIETLVNM